MRNALAGLWRDHKQKFVAWAENTDKRLCRPTLFGAYALQDGGNVFQSQASFISLQLQRRAISEERRIFTARCCFDRRVLNATI
jgi:hypothetical protein